MKLRDRELNSLRYAAFGLSNSDYRYYNVIVDVVDKTLEGCGAERLLTVGKAEHAQGSTEEDFLEWKEALFDRLPIHLGLDGHEGEVKYEPTLVVVEDESFNVIDLHNGEPVHLIGDTKNDSPTKPVRIHQTRELFNCDASKKPGRDCVHLDLDLSDQPQLSYS
jgi:NADPH-ferrihemoprotein reductase